MSRTSFLAPLLVAQAQRYPAWEPADLYKLLHQAARGSEHAAPSREAAAEWLRRELAEMGPGPAEPLVDPIRADGRLARVHLRPWREAGLDPAVLLEAFLKTAAVWREAPGEMDQALQQAVAGAVDLGLASEAVAALAGRMREQGYPAMHHSAEYARLYRPAYRVVAVGLLPPELSALPLG